MFFLSLFKVRLISVCCSLCAFIDRHTFCPSPPSLSSSPPSPSAASPQTHGVLLGRSGEAPGCVGFSHKDTCSHLHPSSCAAFGIVKREHGALYSSYASKETQILFHGTSRGRQSQMAVFYNDILEHSQWFIPLKLLAASSRVLWNHVKALALSGETSGKEMKEWKTMRGMKQRNSLSKVP